MGVKKNGRAATDRKTDALSVRIDPRMRYGLELLSRVQRRAVTGVVEWAIDRAFGEEAVDLSTGTASFRDAVTALWAPNEVNRLILLARKAPQLMTYEESRVWLVLEETSQLWTIQGRQKCLRSDAVLKHWDVLRPMLYDAADRTVVTGLSKEALVAARIPVPNPTFDDDDIPI